MRVWRITLPLLHHLEGKVRIQFSVCRAVVNRQDSACGEETLLGRLLPSGPSGVCFFGNSFSSICFYLARWDWKQFFFPLYSLPVQVQLTKIPVERRRGVLTKTHPQAEGGAGKLTFSGVIQVYGQRSRAGLPLSRSWSTKIRHHDCSSCGCLICPLSWVLLSVLGSQGSFSHVLFFVQ